jgi:hypothetical protein
MQTAGVHVNEGFLKTRQLAGREKNVPSHALLNKIGYNRDLK